MKIKYSAVALTKRDGCFWMFRAGGGNAACLILIGYRMPFAQWPCTGISTKLWTVPSVNNPLPTISPRLLTVTANMESKSQLELAGKNVVRSMPWLVALGQRKGRILEKSSLNP